MTATQREAVLHDAGPLLIIAGAGTGKTTVITRRIAWLITSKRAAPDRILALTFTDKAAKEMEERVDLLVPYGYLDIAMKTFHAFGDALLREHAVTIGLTPHFRVLSQAEQAVFLRRRIFELPLAHFRPLNDPTRYVEALLTFFARAKDEAVGPEEMLLQATALEQRAAASPEQPPLQAEASRLRELANAYAAYQRLLREEDATDFGDQVLLAVQLLERHPDIRAQVQQRFRYLLVDEFQDTNYAQFRLLQLLAAPEANIAVVADDDQSIYKWRGAALSNVVKFLEHYANVRSVVLTENFRSTQDILDAAYRLIRFNDPDRLEVRQGINKKLIAKGNAGQGLPHFQAFDTASSEADWVIGTIRAEIESGARRPGDFAILVRSNRDADIFLRSLNVAGLPWQFSGASGLFAREESKMLLSCLRALADPDDSISWYHVASSPLYGCPMGDVTHVLAAAKRQNRSLRAMLEQLDAPESVGASLSEPGKALLAQLLQDVAGLLDRSRTQSAGQLLYTWLKERGYLARLGQAAHIEDALQLRTVGRFFNQLRRIEELVGGALPEVIAHLELFQAIGNEPIEEDDAWADRVNVLTIHKAKGLEFPVVFMVRLIQGRFPTPQRRDTIELPETFIKDLLPTGDYHLQEERRLFYVGMTRAKDRLHLTSSYDTGGKSVRKISQFVLEALNLPTPTPPAKRPTAGELIERSAPASAVAMAPGAVPAGALRLDAHGAADYLACPLKYRYTHVLRLPVMRHHRIIYGAALHKAVEAFFVGQMRQAPLSEEELLRAFEAAWSSEGFLTRDHETLRLEQGRETLRRFFRQQQAAPEHPLLIEEKFRFPLDEILVVGRFDRVDRQADEAVIIDYKSSDVREQSVADKRTRESLQMLLYALAWRTLHGVLPHHVELRFLESGLTGTAAFDEDDLERGRGYLRQAAKGIRAGAFKATPSEYACQWCAYQGICPSAFQPR